MKNVAISIFAVAVGLVQACGSSGSGGNERANEGAEVNGGSGGSGGAGGISGSGAGRTGGGAAIGGAGDVGGSGGVGGTPDENPAPTGGTGGTAGTGGMMDGPMAGSGGTAGMGGTGGDPAPTGDLCLQGSGNYEETGPYEFGRMDVEIGSQGMYTIFYPEPLEEDCKHPIVAWGNGSFVTGPDVYGFYNEHAASWGIVVAASHNAQVGSGEFHQAGLDYLLSENENPDSMFYGKLSDAAGTSGHSQGGGGADQAASHPNVVAEVNVQGAFGRAPQGVAFLCLTGTEDIATESCKTAVESTSSPANYANWEGGTHNETATLRGLVQGDLGTVQYRRFYTMWFRCFLANDQTACEMFRGGTDCPVCMDSGWAEIYSKNF